MTPEHISETTKRTPRLETGWRRPRLRTQRASAEWIGLGVDVDAAFEALETARREDVEQLRPSHNEAVALRAIRDAAIAALASKAAKLQDLPSLVRLAAIAGGHRDPAWLHAADEPDRSDAAFYSIYVQALRLTSN